jgi:L-alanine-DL-glutamate epimerase-like enolase superfamily enzyme
MVELAVAVERFPIRGRFTIARGSRTEAVVVHVTAHADGVQGHGEAVPYARYGETVEGVVAAIAALEPAGLTRTNLLARLPAGAARNAVDAALWDLEAKRSGQPAWQLAGLPASPGPVVTAYTLSLDTPDAMHAAAQAAAHRPLLKIKLGSDAADLDRLAAVRDGAPHSALIVDANEGWTPALLEPMLAACVAAGVTLIEQPLPAGADTALRGLGSPIPLCADESCHTADDISGLADRYQTVNIKLDKTGGLTAGLRAVEAAQAAGLDIMVGCMVGSSLAMAPALLLTPSARFVDLDGPLLLAADRDPGLTYRDSVVLPAPPRLWG